MTRFIVSILLGGILGALFVSIAIHLLNTATEAPILHDGQYGMIFMETAPVGWGVGGVAAAAVMQRLGIQPPRARQMAWLLIVGGIILSPFLGIAGVMIFARYLYQ